MVQAANGLRKHKAARTDEGLFYRYQLLDDLAEKKVNTKANIFSTKEGENVEVGIIITTGVHGKVH